MEPDPTHGLIPRRDRDRAVLRERRRFHDAAQGRDTGPLTPRLNVLHRDIGRLDDLRPKPARAEPHHLAGESSAKRGVREHLDLRASFFIDADADEPLAAFEEHRRPTIHLVAVHQDAERLVMDLAPQPITSVDYR